MALPAGASITSIGGRRCTAVPRVAAAIGTSSNFSTSPATATAATTTQAAATFAVVKSSAVQAVIGSSSSSSSSLSSSPSPSSSPDAPVIASAAEPSISQSSGTLEALPASTQPTTSTLLTSSSNPNVAQAFVLATTSAADQVVTTPQTVPSTDALTDTPITSSKQSAGASATVLKTNSRATQIPMSQNVYSYQATPSSGAIATTIGYNSPTQAGESPVQSSATAASSLSSSSKINVGSAMGGVVGGVALIGILVFLWWRYIKRRKSRDSLLTPLNGSFDRRGEKYEIDGDSLGPTPLGKRWKAQMGGFCSRKRMDLADLGLAVKAKFGGDSDAPSINMNRGNSQFLEPLQQHSRTNSSLTAGQETALTTRDRLADLWQRFRQDVSFNRRLRKNANDPIDHFTATDSVSEREAERNIVSPNFSQFLVLKDKELRQTTERHRRSQSTATLPQLGSLGLEFNSISGPFADPFPDIQPTIPNISKPPGALTSNPFADPISKSNSSDYVSNVRRSRGLSQPIPKNSGPATRLPSNTGVPNIDASRRPSIAAPSSRYPSTIRTSQDTYRDTVLSALSVSARNAKGRSDPFDLDRPDLLRRPPPVPSQDQAGNLRNSRAVAVQPRIESVHAGKPRIVSNAETYSSSKYSSGVSAVFSEWGDPGPDLGPFVWTTSGPEQGSIGPYDATRGSVNSGQGSQIITVGRAL